MPFAIGLTDAGVVVPRMADFLDEIRARYVAETELDVDWEHDLVLGKLSAIAAQLFGECTEALQAVVDSHDVNAATGVQLSNLAAIVGVTRKKATKSQVPCTLTGTPFTAIPQGRLAEGGGEDGRARWKLKADTVIGADGTVDADFEAEVAGRIEAEPGDIDTIVTPVPGWTAVTNAAKATPGLENETDTELRLRRAQSLQLGSSLGVGGLRAKVLRLEFIESTAVIDNPNATDEVVEGVSMPPNSLRVIVAPDSLTDAQKTELIQLIYDNTPGGIEIAGSDVTGTVTGADGTEKAVAFDYVDDLVANISVTLTMATGYSVADAGPALKLLVQGLIDGLLIGQALRRLHIQALAATVPGVVGCTVLINSLAADLDPTALQQVVLGTWSAV